ncbi:hypothetical protein Pse7429DRAFT_3595 [Pseudanabaena biceps PCC 7429]|uniref:Uncharacterized protein n=1 Tax=Pseudanabaena biceps PCC 7429 TaxID=927668 RepID=L8MTK9_9CYAN|nr:hypothetical protein Pse7429DRAFT_3595 [Pseudanabaena biceps PCC 7429]
MRKTGIRLDSVSRWLSEVEASRKSFRIAIGNGAQLETRAKSCSASAASATAFESFFELCLVAYIISIELVRSYSHRDLRQRLLR